MSVKVFWLVVKWLLGCFRCWLRCFGWLLCGCWGVLGGYYWVAKLFLVVAKVFWVVVMWLLGCFAWFLRCFGWLLGCC